MGWIADESRGKWQMTYGVGYRCVTGESQINESHMSSTWVTGCVTDESHVGRGLGYRWVTHFYIIMGFRVADESLDALQMGLRLITNGSHISHRRVTHWLHFRIQHLK